jgi:DNA replication protein DnaC
VVREVRQYMRAVGEQLDAGRGVWFTGDPGTGKTTLAMLISKAAMEADRTVAIYSLPRLLAQLRDTFQDGSEYSLNDLIDRLSAVDLLHVDDVGTEQSSPWVLEQLYTIVNTATRTAARPGTTNLVRARRDALREQIGDRTVSRLHEIGGDPALFGTTPAGRRTSTPGPAPRPARPPRAGANGEPRPRRTGATRPRRLGGTDGRHRHHRRPVGRRGQGQDRPTCSPRTRTS